MLRSRTTDPTPEKIAKAITKRGHDVNLLLWDRKGVHKDGVTHPARNIEITLLRVKAPIDEFVAVLYLPIWWLYCFYYLMVTKCDVIHAYDLDCLIPSVPVAILRRKRLYYSIGDFYANNIPGNGRIISLARNVIASLERYGIMFSDVLFIADDSRTEEVAGALIKKMYVIYNSPPDAAPRKVAKDTNDLIIFYGGILSPGRGIGTMVDAVRSVPGIRLIIGGVGPEEAYVAKIARQSENIEYLGWIENYSKLIELTNSADVIFRFSDPRIPKTKFESPNKLFEAMMCGKPIIVTDHSAMANIVRNEKCGVVIEYGDANRLKDAIIALKNPNLRERLGHNGRSAYESKYNWEIMEKKIQEAYSF